VDVQQLRQLIRDAKREKEQEKAPAAARKLFQYLKQYQAV
jgi:ribosome-associated protein